MDLRQLEFVVAVADEGGFTVGAAAAHVAQPSLSARVRDLERELGVDLFERVGRGARVSAAGEVVIDRARQVLRDVAALRAAAADVAGLAAGTLEVVSLPTLAVDPVAELIGDFRRDRPGVAVRLFEADDVWAFVRSGRAELGFAELRAVPADLAATPLHDQELLAVLPPGSPGASGRRSEPLARLAGRPLVLTPPGTSSRLVVEAAFAAAGLVPAVAVEAAAREAIVPLVLAGAGAAFLPRALAASARAQGAVVVRITPRLTRPIGVVRRAGRPSPAADAFLGLVSRSDR